MNGPNRNQNNRPNQAPNSPNRNPRRQGPGGGQQGERPSVDGNKREDPRRGGQQQSGQPSQGQRPESQNQNRDSGGNNRNRRGKRNRHRPGGPQQGQGGQPNQQPHRQEKKGSHQQTKGSQQNQNQQKQEAKPVKLQPDFKEIPNSHQIKKYGVIFFETLAAAKAELSALEAKSDGFDQLNVVVRAEANMNDPDFNTHPKLKLFAGAAWTLIHERRNEDGWYDAPR